jgi:potassium channel subfamily K
VSRRQRSLLIIVMLLLVYIAFGALVNSFLIDLDFINGLYFTVVSIETVGFGDIVPDNTSSRVFMCFYIVFGILNLGVAVGVARETIFEQLQNSYQKRLAKDSPESSGPSTLAGPGTEMEKSRRVEAEGDTR